MEEKLVQTHFIVTDIHDEYYIKWTGKIANAKPKFYDNKPIFVIVGSKGNGRMEVNTTDIKYLEKCAKLMTTPKGRGAIATDKCRIFLKEENGNELLMGTLEHRNVKSYAPMFDKIQYE